jgi:hypothetical protein
VGHAHEGRRGHPGLSVAKKHPISILYNSLGWVERRPPRPEFKGIVMPDVRDDEITPEMIEAGALEFARYDPRFDSDEEAAIRIFRAMVVAKSECQRQLKSATDTSLAEAACI